MESEIQLNLNKQEKLEIQTKLTHLQKLKYEKGEGFREDIEEEMCSLLKQGTKLYHRANNIDDKDNSDGEITVKRISGDYIFCETVNGEKRFRFDDIGTFLSFAKEYSNKKFIINEPYTTSKKESFSSRECWPAKELGGRHHRDFYY